VYSKPNKATTVRLNKGQVVIVIEQTNKWLKVKHSESDIGWIKKGDAK
jgi:SH3-like domain-containing protein